MATKRSNGHRNGHRQRMLMLLVATLTLLAWLIWGMIVDLRSRPLSYHIQYTQPVNSFLCPGDTLRYEVQIEVSKVPAALTIVESWCEVRTGGVCNQETTRAYQLGVLRPRQVYTLANRTVPDTPFFRVPGRELEFWHTTTTTTNAGVSVTGYSVGPIVIRDNCGESGEGSGGTK